MPKIISVQLKGNDLERMETLLSNGHIKHKYAVRLQTVLSRAKGNSTGSIAQVLDVDGQTVSKYVNRYNAGSLESLLCDKTRKPGTAPIPDDVKNKLVQYVCQNKPKNEAHWSTRELSKIFGISHTAINTILKEQRYTIILLRGTKL